MLASGRYCYLALTNPIGESAAGVGPDRLRCDEHHCPCVPCNPKLPLTPLPELLGGHQRLIGHRILQDPWSFMPGRDDTQKQVIRKLAALAVEACIAKGAFLQEEPF